MTADKVQKQASPPVSSRRDEIPQLRLELDAFIAAHGFQYYTYVAGRVVGGSRIANFDPRERPFHLTNIPQNWETHYSHKRFYDHDPIILYALKNILPDSWESIIQSTEMTARQHQIISDAEDFGIRGGVIIPVHGPGGEFAVLSLTHDETPHQARSNVEADAAMLQMFALRFHDMVRSLQNPAETEPRALLTSREIDVLFWTAEGKSTWDISQILSISESTVNFHINSVKRKLNVYSKPHAVAKMFSFVDKGKF